MESTRQQKIARLIQKDTGQILQKGSRSLFEGAMITVTKVWVSKDLSIARIYLSIFSLGSTEKEQTMNLVRKYSSEIRKELGVKVRNQLRVIPDLEFYLDDSLDYIENIEKLLKT